VIRFTFSAEAEEALDALVASNPNDHEPIVADLELVAVLGEQALDLADEFDSWVRLVGPTGRVSYWAYFDALVQLWIVEWFTVS
jgi:hypothetical protein